MALSFYMQTVLIKEGFYLHRGLTNIVKSFLYFDNKNCSFLYDGEKLKVLTDKYAL